MKVAISGSSGFIGRHLTNYLNKSGFELVLLDFSTGYDLCNWDQIKGLEEFDVFIHLANKSYVPDSYDNPRSFYDTNIVSTLNILELCRINKAKYLYLSSYVYGNPKYQPIDENHPIQAFNPYSQSKILCEQLCLAFSRDFNIPGIIFRPFNVYGPGQTDSFLIPTILNQLKTGTVKIKDDRPKRDFIHVYDLVRSIRNAIEYKLGKGTEVFNVGSGISYSIKDVMTIILTHFPGQAHYECSNEIRPNEVMDTVADIRKIKSLLNWQPEIDLTSGIVEMLKEA
jgi:nucleoside-diphosphate-sugar epimerase